ncbi:energy transducer TonB, partial [Gammaproteobacteria bacterium]|nr:energy transducer TonB [Gammaproteobacteria bacterium]
MKITSKLINFSLSAFLLAASSNVAAQEASSLSGLLNLVEGDKVSESAEYRARLQEFEQNAARQAQILETTKERITEQERTQGQLSDQFEANEITISDKREVLRDRRGDLNELFGTLQGVAGDFLSNFENSLISAQYLGRSEYIEGFIEKAGSTIEQLDVGEIERFWYFMQQEMTESARVVTYQGEVALPTGETATRSITRIGSFNSISEGEYLSYAGNIGHLQVLPKQPDAGTLSMASDL